MDTKTKETVLRFLVDDYIKSGRHYLKGFPQLCEALPDIEPHILEASLGILKEERLVNYIRGDDMPLGIRLTPSGLAYFDRKEQAKREKWSDRKWDLVQIALGFVGGFISGVLTSLVVYYFIK